MKKVNTAADFPEFSRRIRCGFFQEIMSCEKGSGGIDLGRKGTLMQKRSLAGGKDCERASFLEKGFWMKMTFYEKMAVVCRRIPRGTVVTYGQIALLCGYPTHGWKVDLKKFGWKNTMEEAGQTHE